MTTVQIFPTKKLNYILITFFKDFMTFVLCVFFLLYESIFSLNENKEKKIYNKNEKTQPS